MRTFWNQSLLIGIAIVAAGCVWPQANMSVEERWLADGYPSEYIDGLNAGCEAFCRELLADKIQYPHRHSRYLLPAGTWQPRLNRSQR